MSEHDEVYGAERMEQLIEALRALAERIRQLDASRQLLAAAPELIERMGHLRSELFHYEVRSTYDTPEVAENRRIIEEAQAPPEFTNPFDPEDDEPWRPPSE